MRLNQIAANRTEIEFSNGTRVFFSYTTPVAAYVVGEGLLRTDKRRSVTTSKHIGQWLEGRHFSERPQAFFDSLAEEGDAQDRKHSAITNPSSSRFEGSS